MRGSMNIVDNPLHNANKEIELRVMGDDGIESLASDDIDDIHSVEDGKKGPFPWYATLLAMCASLNALNTGYEIGTNTGIAASLQREDQGLYLNDTQLEMYMGSYSLTAVLGAICMYMISDPYGRRRALLVAQIIIILGIIVIMAANSFDALIVGRLIMGLAAGLSFAVDSQYISEIAPEQYRGQLVSWGETATNVGILFGFVTGYIFRNVTGNAQWKIMISLGCIAPVILILLIFVVMPETPRWLLIHGRHEEAADVLRKLSPNPGTANGHKLAKKVMKDIEEEQTASGEVTWLTLFETDVNRRKVRAGVGVALMQQLTAIDGVQYYLIIILKAAGVRKIDTIFTVLVILGVVKTSVIVVAGYLFDRIGRRTALMSSNLCIAVALFLIAIGLEQNIPELTLTAILLFMISFSLGMGPGAWLVPSEVFSNDIRAKGMSLSTFANRSLAVVVSSSFLSMMNAMDYGVFLFFALLCIGNATYVYLYLPETRNLSLEEVHQQFVKEF